MFNSSKLKINKKYHNHLSLTILILIVSIITYYRVLIQIDIGPLSDSCDFLSNALVFAGQEMSYFDPSRPPLFSFLISLIFRIGYVSTNIIFILDGLLYIFGVAGMYFLLKLQFNNIKSFLGALLYATFPMVLIIMSTGFSDLAGVSLTIWAFYFLILAVKRDSKFFYLAFPLVMLAFLTRYNNGLLVFPIFLYILINRTEIKFKNLFMGMFASMLFLIPVFIFFSQKFGNMFYPFISVFGTTSETILPGNAAYDPNLFFFIQNFPAFTGSEGIFILLVLAVGFFIYCVLKFKQRSGNKKFINNSKVERLSTKLKLILFGVLALLFSCSFGNILAYYSEVLFFILSYLLYDLIKNLKIKNIDIHLLFMAWFMAFFIFHSVQTIKDNRYFVIMAPAVAYFLILGLSEISNKLTFKVKYNVTFPTLAVILTVIILFSTISIMPGIKQSNNDTRITNEIVYPADEWFINYDPDYKSKIIYSDLYPYFCWDLKTNVRPMPTFKDGQKYYGGVKDFSITSQDNMAYNNELGNNNADYYFSFREGVNLTSYIPIKQFKYLIIYKKKTKM